MLIVLLSSTNIIFTQCWYYTNSVLVLALQLVLVLCLLSAMITSELALLLHLAPFFVAFYDVSER